MMDECRDIRNIFRMLESIKVEMLSTNSQEEREKLFKEGQEILMDNCDCLSYQDYITLTKELLFILKYNPQTFLLFLNEYGFSIKPAVAVEDFPLSEYFAIIVDNEMLITKDEEKAYKMKLIGNLVLQLYDIAEYSKSEGCVFLAKIL